MKFKRMMRSSLLGFIFGWSKQITEFEGTAKELEVFDKYLNSFDEEEDG